MSIESNPSPYVASATMGYGHLRAAYPIAEAVGGQVVEVDIAPVSDAKEMKLWGYFRKIHEVLSKPLPVFKFMEDPMVGLMNALTMIPSLHEPREHHLPNAGVRLLDALIRRGLGRGMVEQLQRSGAPLVTTFYAPAIIADRAGIERVVCVITDADCNRVWASMRPAESRIHYCAPSTRVVRRLRSFGVPSENITLTGFPLPRSLTESEGPHALERIVMGRIARLDPHGVFRKLYAREVDALLPFKPERKDVEQPVRVLFAVGGAGAQVELARAFLPSLRDAIVHGRFELYLASGVRPEVQEQFRLALRRAGLTHQLGKRVHWINGNSFAEYYAAFNQALLQTDVLWTKPSELSFYAALGLPCVLTKPVGSHERYNRRWLREQGAGLKQRQPELANGWLSEWLEDGTLAGAAWAGYLRLPKGGTEQIAAIVRNTSTVDGKQFSSTHKEGNASATSSHFGSASDRA